MARLQAKVLPFPLRFKLFFSDYSGSSMLLVFFSSLSTTTKWNPHPADVGEFKGFERQLIWRVPERRAEFLRLETILTAHWLYIIRRNTGGSFWIEHLLQSKFTISGSKNFRFAGEKYINEKREFGRRISLLFWARQSARQITSIASQLPWDMFAESNIFQRVCFATSQDVEPYSKPNHSASHRLLNPLRDDESCPEMVHECEPITSFIITSLAIFANWLTHTSQFRNRRTSEQGFKI